MANKVYQHEETAVTWASSGGTELFTATSLASAAGRQGALHDFTTAARARRLVLRAWFKPGATRVVGERVEVYVKTGDGTHYDNNDGTGDIAVSAQDKLRNLWPIGVIQIDKNAADEMGSQWDIELSARYGAPVYWNASANSLSATATDFGVSMTPVPDELQ